MMNYVVLIGRLTKDIELKSLEDGKKTANIAIATPRSFKDGDGKYETDFFNIILWDTIAKSTAEYCKKGDLIGIKGRLQCNKETKNKTEIIAERITFLSSQKVDE